MLSSHLRPTLHLIEVILVISIALILGAVITFSALPRRELAELRDRERRNDVARLFVALRDYRRDHGQTILSTIPRAITPICRTYAATTTTCFDLTSTLVHQAYLSFIPVDPLETDPAWSGYVISYASGTPPYVTIAAPRAERDPHIGITGL